MGDFYSDIFYGGFLVFFGYFVLLSAFYIFLVFAGLLEGKKRYLEEEAEDYPLAYLSKIAISVSIIVPARNEREWIHDCLLSILNLNYPKFELIVVDDGSTDGTLEVMNNLLDLKPVDMPYVKHYRDGTVISMLKSRKHPNVTVVHKMAGVKKAGAVNAGLNIAKNDYVCVIDADTVLEPNALLKVMSHVERDPDHIIGIGSYFGLSNGLDIREGRIHGRKASLNPIISYQNLEYIRSFIGNRIGWSRYNAMPVVAGGFFIWRRDVLYELEGYSIDFTCEDIEFTFRAHDYAVKNREKGYKIEMLPYPAGWTEGPSNVRSLISQRSRWQRVTNETMWHYKYMILNPRYGSLAFLTMPYFLLYEVLGVFFEVTSLIFVAAGWWCGMLDVRIFLIFLGLMVLSQALVSVVSLFSFVRIQRFYRVSYIAYLVFLSFFEFLWYRWIISVAKLVGTAMYLMGVKTQDQYSRAKRPPAEKGL